MEGEHIGKSQVLGVGVHQLTMAEVVAIAGRAIGNGLRLRVGVVNAAKLTNMRTDPLLYNDVTSSDLVLADGMSVVWAAKFLGDPLPERVAGIDLMLELLQYCSDHNRRVFFLGATAQICQTVVAKSRVIYPNVDVAGFRDGYFAESDESEIVSEINKSDADVLFVAMSSPKKERFMGRWANQLTCRVIHGVGGSFDVFAGKVSRAPVWMQKSGLEWLHRVVKEPRRMWRRYLYTNIKFIVAVLKEKVKRSK